MEDFFFNQQSFLKVLQSSRSLKTVPPNAEHQRSKHTHTPSSSSKETTSSPPQKIGNTGTTTEYVYMHSDNLLLFRIWQYSPFYSGYVNSIAWLDFLQLGLFPNLAFSRLNYGGCDDISQVLWPLSVHVNSTIIKLRFYSGFLTHRPSVYSNGWGQQNTWLFSGYTATLTNAVSCTAAKRMHIEELYFVWKRISVTPSK